MESHKDCPRCSGSLQEGFILNHSRHNVNVVAKWQLGEPQKSCWTGVNTKDSPQYEITAYRCKGRGYRESYAK